MKNIFKFSIKTEVMIEAPKSIVWRTLVDFQNYKKWNPHIYLIEGSVREGEILKLHLHWPGLRPEKYQLKITNITAEDHISWLGHFKIPGLLDGHNHYNLSEAKDGKTRVEHQEFFSGLLVPFFKPWLRSSVTMGFLNIDKALTDYCEADLNLKDRTHV